MEKLIELLNEYIPEGWEVAHGGKSIFYEGLNYTDRVISKSFGFIKWLVDNDKIDMIILGKIGMYGDLEQCRINTTNAIIMILSITENPIDFLISILK